MYPIKPFLCILLLSSAMPSAWALRSDRNQPIDIRADRVEIDQHQHISHYQGNVQMIQGSLKINADEVVVYMDSGKLQKIVIMGKPARFEQLPENKQDIVQSQAEHMEYFAGEERLLLRRNAEVNQGANHFRGDFIEYDTLTSTVKARKDEDSQSRVHAIIQPAAKDEQNDKQSSQPAEKP
jgi:lipopolysaccharide export system protein LptA